MHWVCPPGRSPEHHESGRVNGFRDVNRWSRRSEVFGSKGKVRVLEARLPIIIGVQTNVRHGWSIVVPIGVADHLLPHSKWETENHGDRDTVPPS